MLYQGVPVDHDCAQAYGRVDPDHHGRGLGAFLVDAVEARWVDEPADRRRELLRHWLNAGDPAAAELLTTRAYGLVRREFHLERALADRPEPVMPEGIGIRRFRAGEERELYFLDEEAFAEHWGFRQSNFEEWAWVLDSTSFDPELVLVAEDGGTLVGEAWLQVTPEGGWVNVLGVRPGWRGRGIGRALLLSGFAELAARGCERALLGVDAGNESGALRLYEGAGMTVRREWHVYEKGSRLGSPE